MDCVHGTDNAFVKQERTVPTYTHACTHTHTNTCDTHNPDLEPKRVWLVGVHTCVITITLLPYAQICQFVELAERLNTAS